MSVDKAFSADKNQALAKAIMDYYLVPGRFALNLRQPAIAFQQFDKVIAWAQGKISDEHVVLDDALQKASIFFVQRVCFRVENSHYDVLGLDREFKVDVLRPRYRALINLTHPDKNISGLPTNAAVRINKAYDVLRSTEQRASYDASLFDVRATPFDSLSVAPASYVINAVAFKDRIQVLIPNFKTLVFLVVPVLLAMFVVAVIAFSRGQADSDLVEKKSTAKRYSQSDNLNENSLELSKIPAPLEPGLIVDQDLLQQKASVLEPVLEAYKTVVRSVDAAKPQLIPKDLEQQFSGSEALKKSVESDAIVNNVTTLAAASAANSIASVNSENTVGIAKAALVSSSNSPSVAVESSRSVLAASNPIQAKSDPLPLPMKLTEARFNLTQLISSLERPSDIEFLHSKLMRQGVSGNLFGLALPLVRDAAVIRIDQFTFNEKLDRNLLILNGTVAFMLATHSGQLTPYRYAINAEFKDVEKSSTMSRFELKEIR